jgi:hypothetical protein
MSQKINFVPATLPVVQQKVFEVLSSSSCHVGKDVIT